MLLHKHFITDGQREALLSLVTKPDADTPARVSGVTATVLDDGRVQFEGNHGPIDQLRYILNTKN
jgi:hypothetical protein